MINIIAPPPKKHFTIQSLKKTPWTTYIEVVVVVVGGYFLMVLY